MQSRSTLYDKIFTEKEEFRLGYSKNPDFFAVENKGYRADSNFGPIYFASGDSYDGTTPFSKFAKQPIFIFYTVDNTIGFMIKPIDILKVSDS